MSNSYPQAHRTPLEAEHVSFDLPVTGRIPTGLDGLYARTGPNALPGQRSRHGHHPIDDGMVHGVRLQDGRCLWQRNRWIATPEVARALGSADANPEPPSLPGALVPEGTGNAALCCHAGRLYALSELGLPWELSPNLETLGVRDFGGPLPAGSITHPHLDARSGELQTLGYHPDPPFLRHHVIDARGHMIDQRTLPLDRPTMIHDFGLTAEHLVLFDLPALFSEEAMLDGEPLPYRWDADGDARIGLFPRRGDAAAARWFTVDPCWITHFAAVRSRNGVIEIDLIRRRGLEATGLEGSELDGSGLEAHGPRFDARRGARSSTAAQDPPRLAHCRIDPRSDHALIELHSETPQDLPSRDPRAPPGQDTRFWTLGLATADGAPLPAGDRIIAHVPELDRCTEYPLEAGWLASELTFVPRHPRAALHDGWLIGFLHRDDGPACNFAVFDTQALRRGPVATIALPQRVPFGGHGCWVGDVAD